MKRIRQYTIIPRVALIVGSLVISVAVLAVCFVFLKRTGANAVYPVKIRRENLLFPQVATFKHYYEPKPNEVLTDHPDWLGYTVTNYSNGDGLNERRDYAVPKPPKTVRIITIGDSFTYGSFVDTDENYTEILESLLTSQRCDESERFEVINFGVPGYDIGYTVEQFIRKGPKYSPDLVIWLMNDFNFYQIRDLMISREEEINANMSAAERKKHEDRGDFYYAAEVAMREFGKRYGDQSVLRQQETYLLKFGLAYKGPLLLVRFADSQDPKVREIVTRFTHNRPQTQIYPALPSLTGLGARLPDTHPNVLGHRLIAAHIYAYLFGNSFLPCRTSGGSR